MSGSDNSGGRRTSIMVGTPAQVLYSGGVYTLTVNYTIQCTPNHKLGDVANDVRLQVFNDLALWNF